MGVLGGKIGEGVVRYWPPWTRSYFSGSYVCANFCKNRSRNVTVRVLADGQIHSLTDANQFYNLSHAIYAIAMGQITRYCSETIHMSGKHWYSSVANSLRTLQRTLSQSCKFYGRHDKNILAYFLLGHIIGILTMFTTFKFYKVVKQYNSVKLGNITTMWLLRGTNTHNYENWSILTEWFLK